MSLPNELSETETFLSSFHDGFNSLVKIFVDNGLTIRLIKDAFEHAMVSLCLKESPELTNMEVSFKTGIDRRKISAIRNGDAKNFQRQDKYSFFISCLKEHQEQQNNGFPLSKDQYNELFKKHLNGSNSPTQVLKSLEKYGYVKIQDEFIMVLEWGRLKKFDDVDILEQTSRMLKRMINTKYKNKAQDNQRYEMAWTFRDIPLTQLDEVDAVVLKKMRKFERELDDAIEPFRRPNTAGCAREYGYYFLQYSDA
ncbi:hypothetical protein [Marinicella sp. W31]|uniref:hypothetical protein n=1 Tax=Marinicella sp. W31 TaxID=3023713 RepID=UPI003756565D